VTRDANLETSGVADIPKGLVDKNSGVDSAPNKLLESYKASSLNTVIGLLSPSRLIEGLVNKNAHDLVIEIAMNPIYNYTNGLEESRTS
jgi:hypothetical protein